MLKVCLKHRAGQLDLSAEFTAPTGVTALFGPSGAGKSTIVNAISGLLRPAAGRITLGGTVLFDSATRTNLPLHKRRIGYVFQEPRLFPHLGVRGNLDYGRRRAPKDAQGPDFDQVIGMLGIAPLLGRRVAALSGGEKARISIGRALLSKPQILLMDEPLAALDAPRRAEILPFLENLRDTGLPIVYVSHSVSEIARLADTLVVIEAGRTRASGPLQTLLAEPDLAPLFGQDGAGAVIHVQVAGQDPDGMTRVQGAGGTLFLTEPHPVGQTLRLRIQASDVILSRQRPEGLSALNILSGQVQKITPTSKAEDRFWVQIRCGDETLLAKITARSRQALDLRPDTECHAILKTVAVERRAPRP
ncbi:molybdenum ABC transporter ATP-binding protein [Thioclava litoralis]|uniref:Molybdenum ABC transporter ATP-binding protein n=1 Tax=Thioclava litoralis TaxID=3076557 RepID=A0ABZ1E2Q5_9RHOB|nr:molybdenum ABC transporter ATP-binding protein [Thioclava sp. FTW29]